MKIDRLMGLAVYLINNGRTSAGKLAEVFEVSPRTIVRDLDSLDRAGIPIRSVSGTGGGYQIMDGYIIDRQAATGTDYDWIITALSGMASGYPSSALRHTLDKIKSLHGSDGSAISMDLSAAAENAGIKKQLRLLEDAIERKCMVRFSYTNSRNETSIVQAEPVRLIYKWYNWYLAAYYEKHMDYCMFKLVRMERIELTGVPNPHDHDSAAIEFSSNTDNMISIKLFCKAAIRSRCKEYLNGRVTREYENGDFEFSFSVPEHEAFWYGALISFGSSAKVLEPPELRERILKNCAEIQEVYASD